ncbi:bifunctional 2-C-methyl-D-erythritol 4-phosphate cytidylyltransferase/2-C-methyl-D-erythritol 2,4-cyclodiphosphate synthase [Emcibacter sp. SYSU 3D8]|uniref:bifunctional 2-C-methyl-D-erythritol 4-phosphate cytidylyltransferase/2-C-methyl-D-erythritol 2,4-cyclodiphosphate synthase n=1 Tax=Emcibacter sp. SYSU 3D8 TaxID=3133969 RepID=UPI0031FE581F
MKVAALIVAAGRGQRAGAPLPKQYLDLRGEPILRHSVKAFLDSGLVHVVQVVIHPGDRPLYDRSTAGLGLPEPCSGGTSRQESVRLGLEALAAGQPDLVLIHDAARPFVSAMLIRSIVDALSNYEAVIPGLAVTDTIKQVVGGTITGNIDRDSLRRAQTPQGFHYRTILEAHRTLADVTDLTDDAAVAERAGHTVLVIDGDERNIKVTTPEDVAALSAHAMLPCSGSGFDVHRLGPGDHVMLCGHRIPHSQGLIGHSDADVALHALVDAILGALGAGDIGRHFPPSDPQWQGAPSRLFLEEAVRLVRAQGGRIANVDVTIICEAPKVTPYVQPMTAVLAEILGIPARRINVKATTTEKLGFTGRGEGIAAQAACSLLLPDAP